MIDNINFSVEQVDHGGWLVIASSEPVIESGNETELLRQQFHRVCKSDLRRFVQELKRANEIIPSGASLITALDRAIGRAEQETRQREKQRKAERAAARPATVAMVAIADINIGGRARQELGDIPALAASIKRLGLLHPIVLNQDNKLVVGRRRIEAYRHLGRDTIPAHIANNMVDLQLALEAERDENTCRKEFTPSEAVAIGAAIEETYRPLAAKRKGGDKKSAAAKSVGGNSPIDSKPKRDEGTRTTAVAAAAVNMDRRTYEKAKAVVKSGGGDLIGEMNRTGKVNASYKKLRGGGDDGVSGRSIDHGTRVLKHGTQALVKAVDAGILPVSVAAQLATLPAAQQTKTLAGGKRAVTAALKEIAEAAKPDWAKGPSPSKVVEKDPERRWLRSVHDIYVLLNSTRDAGGAKALAAEWSAKGRRACAEEAREVAAELEQWAKLMEGGA